MTNDVLNDDGISDYWSQDSFEDTVAAALITCFERKVKKNRGAIPSDRLTPERFQSIVRLGPYIPSTSRYFLGGEDNAYWHVDTQNDPLPEQGTFSFAPSESAMIRKDSPGTYFALFHLQKVKNLGKGWHTQAGGTLYEIFQIEAVPEGVIGERFFVTVTKEGMVVPCDVRALAHSRIMGGKSEIIGHEKDYLMEKSIWASMTIQGITDKRFCWSITAQEKTAKAQLGCMEEEIKSLLYARTLPLSATGRKRPILHLIEAHKRRLKNGTDIDITAFLRGIPTVEIEGTLFTVNPPMSIRGRLSKNSQKHFS